VSAHTVKLGTVPKALFSTVVNGRPERKKFARANANKAEERPLQSLLQPFS